MRNESWAKTMGSLRGSKREGIHMMDGYTNKIHRGSNQLYLRCALRAKEEEEEEDTEGPSQLPSYPLNMRAELEKEP
eukprot:TCALIF_04627-PA protein Name:"Protein of unknown function" AED:0.11 eAED:0.65 QI:0/0/0.33/1/0/0/3/127/76